MGEHIFYGPWVNWSHGAIKGATLTLGDRSGALLTAFIAFWVTLVSAQLFRILTYIFHQARSKRKAQDGLYHQQQVIFRNTATPGGAAWSFLLQWWTWNGKARSNFLRTLPWALFCIVYMVAFAAAAVFSSEITKGPGSARLVIGDTCGYWEQDSDGLTDAAIRAYAKRVANQSLANSAYARQCYSGSDDMLGCTKFTKPALTYTVDTNASCPFDESMCLLGSKASYQITSQKIDSLYDLGINSRHSDRLYLQKVSTCTPLKQKGYVETVSGGNGTLGYETDTWYQFYFGETSGSNYTYQYNDHTSIDGVGYQLNLQWHLAGPLPSTGGWMPIVELNRSDADVSVMFFAQNGVFYPEAVDDPIFSAHIDYDLGTVMAGGGVYYLADNYVTAMGCADQFRICNPENDVCTMTGGINQIIPWIIANNDKIDLNVIQQALSMRLIRTVQSSSINTIVFALGDNAIAAKDVVVQGKLSTALPSNQWHLEMEGWVDKGLADLQIQIVEYATGPKSVGSGSFVYQPWAQKSTDPEVEALNLVAEAMCYSQMINDASDTVSFSIAGMVVLFAVGGVFIFLGIFIDTIVGWVQRKWNIGSHARMCWLLDDKLQLHRYLNQELGHGEWSSDVENMPTTVKVADFSTLAVAHENTYNRPTYDSGPQQQQTAAMQYPVQRQSGGAKYTKVTATEELFFPK